MALLTQGTCPLPLCAVRTLTMKTEICAALSVCLLVGSAARTLTFLDLSRRAAAVVGGLEAVVVAPAVDGEEDDEQQQDHKQLHRRGRKGVRGSGSQLVRVLGSHISWPGADVTVEHAGTAKVVVCAAQLMDKCTCTTNEVPTKIWKSTR